MYTVYILKSRVKKYLYVGLTSNLEERLKRHNNGWERTTKAYRPFDLICTEQYKTRAEARKREKYLKSGCGKEWIKTELL
ncbi:MAG: GIY-YIG nuclease family protein [Candidatus Gracilibacteria bacterium]|nr:GIY-YIG nuclease family protein [Candidatus Gracilibacteria bacterium]